MVKKSAGILLFRKLTRVPEVFLVHPGGPFWKNKNEGAWSIPKGEFDEGEDALAAAKREFHEETGFHCKGDFIPLSPVRLKSGKTVHAWALKMDLDPEKIKSNTFELEWPPRSGKRQMFPEIDKGAWFTWSAAKKHINTAQAALLDELALLLKK